MKQILEEANRLLGQGLINGQTSTYYSTVNSVITNIVAGINEVCPVNTVIRESGLAEPEAYFNSLKISPNTAEDEVTIELNLFDASTVSISIYDTKGALLKTINNAEPVDAGTKSFLVDCADWPEGVYFVRCTVSNRTEVRKLIIVK